MNKFYYYGLTSEARFHQLYDTNMNVVSPGRLSILQSGGLTPATTREPYKYRLGILGSKSSPKWTFISFWDHSVRKIAFSQGTFFASGGTHSHVFMLESFEREFHEVFDRLPYLIEV